MLFFRLRPSGKLGRAYLPGKRSVSSTHAQAPSEPLRILFCGSDEFSCASLKALHDAHVQDKSFVASLDVVVRPPKPTGRGYKTLREVPCKSLAEQLGLRIHQRATFTQWEIPTSINLIIAVSFGLFVPPRILRAAKFGGLNVHPSLLPDLRGPAPIHHAILRGYEYTGVSLQTLDDKAFDHGTILAQTPFPGISIPPRATVEELTSSLAPIGAQMLVQGLRDKVHVPPHRQVGWKLNELHDEPFAHAPKVTKADGQVDWSNWTAEDVLRRMQALGSVWTHAFNKRGQVKRLILRDADMASPGDATALDGQALFLQKSGKDGAEGRQKMRMVVLDDGSCLIQLANAVWIKVRRVKEEGKAERDAAAVLQAYVTPGTPL